MPSETKTWFHAEEALRRARPLVFEDEWAAIDELRLLAAAGVVRTRAAAIRRQGEEQPSWSEPGPLDPAFWMTLIQDQAPADNVEDWQAGRFRCRPRDGDLVEASGVEFCVEDIRRWMPGFAPEMASQQEDRSAATRRGRRPANWWPAFAEELAIYLHDQGPPPGEGSEGSEQVIEAVLARLSDRDITANRTSIQPVVVAALRRLRAPAA